MAQSQTQYPNVPNASVSVAQTDPQLAQYAVVSLNSTALLGLHTTPFSILAAPGTGFTYVVDNIVFEMNATSTAYAAGGAVTFVYHGGSTVVHTGSVAASIITATGPTTTFTQLGPAVVAGGTTLATNTGIDATCATSFTTGTGTAKVYIAYTIMAT